MRNLTMMTDLYELTMMNGYLQVRHGKQPRLLRYAFTASRAI